MYEGGHAGSLSPADLASLWGVDRTVFETGVMRRTVTAGGTSASVALNAAQVGRTHKESRFSEQYNSSCRQTRNFV